MSMSVCETNNILPIKTRVNAKPGRAEQSRVDAEWDKNIEQKLHTQTTPIVLLSLRKRGNKTQYLALLEMWIICVWSEIFFILSHFGEYCRLFQLQNYCYSTIEFFFHHVYLTSLSTFQMDEYFNRCVAFVWFFFSIIAIDFWRKYLSIFGRWQIQCSTAYNKLKKFSIFAWEFKSKPVVFRIPGVHFAW